MFSFSFLWKGKKLRIIGDVHGYFALYEDIANGADHSIQLGDFGFKPEWNKLIFSKLSSDNHKIIPGNHDDYDFIKSPKASAYTFGKDYGMQQFQGWNFFFIRGAYSIDKNMRIPYRSWWPEEQLTPVQFAKAFDEYEEAKPKIILSHDAPSTIIQKMFGRKSINNHTSECLNAFLDHKPDLWIFGHWHESKIMKIGGTEFICLNELEFIDL